VAVVRGDKIGESKRLNRCSVQASDFYAAMLAHEVPDDFGRFRDDAQFVHLRMYPRRELTPVSLRRVARLMSELQDAHLWRVWRVDGVRFAEMYKWKARGNLFHRTPEPPEAPSWPVHEHSKRCARTGLARARDWGDDAGAKVCLNLLNKIGPTEVEQSPDRGRTEPERDPEQRSNRARRRACTPSLPSLPSHPSLPYGRLDVRADGPPPDRSNPLVAGRREELEREALRLASEVARLQDKDPVEVMQTAAHYQGARTSKLNPATMSDDRLANTVLDLRATLEAERAKPPPPERPG
jgi:hypothetical protein